MSDGSKVEEGAGTAGSGAKPTSEQLAAITKACDPELCYGITPKASTFVVADGSEKVDDPVPEVPTVDACGETTHGRKFVIFTVTSADGTATKNVVRGGDGSTTALHRNAFMAALPAIEGKGLKPSRPSSGGRLVHTADCILVFGESGDFGRPKEGHKEAATLLARAFPAKLVAYSDDPEGY